MINESVEYNLSKPEDALILIIDDLEDNIMLLESILSVEGYNVISATKGSVGLKLTKERKPDIILLDLVMPELDGFEVCRFLKEDDELKNIPIFILTAYDEKENLLRGFKSGAVDFISRPFNSAELIARIKNHLDLKKAKDELIRNQEELKRKNTQLDAKNIQLNKLNLTKDKFFSIIAHDLRSPFMSIFSAITMLMRRINSSQELGRDDLNEVVSHLYDNSKAAFSLIDNLLVWAKTQTEDIKPEPSELKLRDIVEDNIDLFRENAISKSVAVVNNVNSQVLIYADNNMVKSIIRNLISNALKYTLKDGAVRIDTENKDDRVIIIVSDTGIGMTQKEISKVFRIDEKFWKRGTEGERGTGLGLVISKEFVEKNGGRMWVESEAGFGSKFFVELPATKNNFIETRPKD